MKDIWKNHRAFAPMFCNSVKVYGVRTNNTRFQSTVDACVFSGEDVDPFNDSSAETTTKKVVMFMPTCSQTGAPLDCKVQIGDTLVTEDQSRWEVSAVDLADDCYKIEARSV